MTKLDFGTTDRVACEDGVKRGVVKPGLSLLGEGIRSLPEIFGDCESPWAALVDDLSFIGVGGEASCATISLFLFLFIAIRDDEGGLCEYTRKKKKNDVHKARDTAAGRDSVLLGGCRQSKVFSQLSQL